MISPGNLSGCSAVIWLLVTGSAALGGPVQTIQLQCGKALQQPLCDALAGALSERFPGAEMSAADGQAGPADLTLRYVGQSRAADWISGYLEWQHRDGRTGQSPAIEQSVMDGQLTADSIADFAGHLVGQTKFPL
ncbi:hypothetical protein [Leisingera caerulea]|uniref:Uncharacterized protein n=1 Tax=Leisingera caerulea TaxID=506591 RepID=A0A9Q9HEJ7_LEICA|nr:hypothetical protein [Leisingera caerulea]UWQ53343.1 hypothetical protein K3721_15325 [Leisingera caerulea]